ncbi:MAG TPA: hypothetical protein VL485_07840 [Ktedonobacteraceae bacterium]|nr:hypothetical protein [Ktedonobacteraceae bacterium]
MEIDEVGASECDVPTFFLFLACKGPKEMLANPTDHKTGTIFPQNREPICGGISTIKDMDKQWTPFPDTDAQSLFFGVSQAGGKDAFGGPPPTQLFFFILWTITGELSCRPTLSNYFHLS